MSRTTKYKLAPAAITAVVLMLARCGGSDEAGGATRRRQRRRRRQQPRLPRRRPRPPRRPPPASTSAASTSAAAITKERASAIALARTKGGRVTKVETDSEDNRRVWKVKITKGRDRSLIRSSTRRPRRIQRQEAWRRLRE
jgi:uncharacterized membrane protein YkoI